MTVGIVGAGQLGRMLALAGYPLGLDFLFIDRSADSPGGQVAPILCGDLAAPRLLAKLARQCDVVTFDWENVPVTALQPLVRTTRVYPPLRALAAAQDRLSEKRLFEKLAIPTTRFAPVDSLRQLQKAVAGIGLPGVLKTRRLGYDGKGQFVLRTSADIERAWTAVGAAPCLYENLVRFDHEVSVIGVRARDGEIAIYPLNCNVHRDGILRLTRAPFGAPALTRRANAALRRVLQHFNYVGVLTIEFFVQDGELIANEIAPRVHNSGHWTIEGAVTSQFENHLRAIVGLPLGSTSARGHSAMINLIGTLPAPGDALSRAGVHWHDYGKSARPGRKLGHITVVAEAAAQRDRIARALLKVVDRETWVSFR
ncbi:MAG TPA: 5-(carboxyamino)imidazole ribonucleotide synthase [Steroidobacteraceae bacterium]|nr:5-(carboxyamino)imidazole ribonucleotide synthase [Steroidobacteraceae bacterium]HRX88668.1 5-(carboxyamino)imidazole ribonucleotide synthase [Steroidobacteraceae bacterium]